MNLLPLSIDACKLAFSSSPVLPSSPVVASQDVKYFNIPFLDLVIFIQRESAMQYFFFGASLSSPSSLNATPETSINLTVPHANHFWQSLEEVHALSFVNLIALLEWASALSFYNAASSSFLFFSASASLLFFSASASAAYLASSSVVMKTSAPLCKDKTFACWPAKLFYP